jgi:lipoprotein-anchoring transpeptidase ErfK/SrfK
MIRSKKKKYNVLLLILTIISGLCFVTVGITEAKTMPSVSSSTRSVKILHQSKLPSNQTTLVGDAMDQPEQKTEPEPTPSPPSINKPIPAPEPTPAPQKPVLPQGTLLVVDKNKFMLSFYQDGQKVESYSAGIGKHQPETETPTGQFEVIARAINPPLHQGEQVIPGGDPKNALGPRALWLNAGINVPDSIGIHGTSAGASVGRPQTEGCVQLNNSDICTLFNQVPVGTPVWIGTSDQLADWGI